LARIRLAADAAQLHQAQILIETDKKPAMHPLPGDEGAQAGRREAQAAAIIGGDRHHRGPTAIVAEQLLGLHMQGEAGLGHGQPSARLAGSPSARVG